MKIPIPSEVQYLVPEGKYRAFLREVRYLTSKKQVRLIFEIISKRPGKGRYVAGKNYDINLEKGSPLRQDLASLRGYDLTAEEIEQGDFDCDTLIGTDCDLLIAHISNADYDQPFVAIAKMLPVGALLPKPNVPELQPAF
jgi:hypothetical protein